MKALLSKTPGKPDALVLEDVPALEPGKGEIVIDAGAQILGLDIGPPHRRLTLSGGEEQPGVFGHAPVKGRVETLALGLVGL